MRLIERRSLTIDPITFKIPPLALIFQKDVEDHLQLLLQRRGLNGRDGFHPTVQISGHPIGAADVKFFLAPILEVINSRVLKITTHNAHDVNIFTDAWPLWDEATHATNDQVNFDPRLRSFIKEVDHVDVGQRIHFGNDPRFTTGPGHVHFTLNQRDHPRPECQGGYQ